MTHLIKKKILFTTKMPSLHIRRTRDIAFETLNIFDNIKMIYFQNFPKIKKLESQASTNGFQWRKLFPVLI